MYPNYYRSPLVASLTLALSFSANAAELINLEKEPFSKLKQKFAMELPGTRPYSKTMDSLKFTQQRTDQNQVTHIRLEQYYSNLPVIGGYAIIHQPNSTTNLFNPGKKTTISGVVYQGIEKELGQPKASFLRNKAAAINALKNDFNVNEGLISEEEAIPVVYIDENFKAHWAYKVSFLIESNNKIPEKPTAILDAETYKPFVKWNDIKTGKVSVKAAGHGGNKKAGQYTYGINYPLLDILRDNQTKICYMENAQVKVIDMKHKYGFSNNNLAKQAMQFECTSYFDESKTIFWTGYENDGYDKVNGAFSPSNDALYAGQVIKDLYSDWYKMEVLTKKDGSPMQLVMRVHYGNDYQNAYWDGKQMTFGDGGDIIYPLVSLGVAAHEISHGFTEQHSNLAYFGQSGGLNESFSDMAAQAAEYYSTGVNSWQIGSEIMKEDSGYEAIRFMDKPSKDGRSIDSADKYRSGIDVHYSSGVYNRLFYLMATTPGWNTRKAFDVMVAANAFYWGTYSSFKDAGCGVLKATADLKYPLADVKSALKGVSIDYSLCEESSSTHEL